MSFHYLVVFGVIGGKPQGGGGGENLSPRIDRAKYLTIHWLRHNSKPKSQHISNLQSDGDFNGGSYRACMNSINLSLPILCSSTC